MPNFSINYFNIYYPNCNIEKKIMKTNKKSGFTLIELIVCLIALAIIVTIISVLGFGGYEIVHHMH